MKRMKYIVVDNGMYDTPIIFDEATEHSTMLGNVAGTLVSAGFVSFSKEGLQCFGKSVSLEKSSRPEEDSALINRLIGAVEEELWTRGGKNA